MKLACASLVLLIVAAAPVAAQTRAEVGVIGGINLADLEVDDEEVDPDLFKKKSQPLFGGIIKVGGHRAAFRTGLLYLKKGGQFDPDAGLDGDFTLTYLEVPLHVIVHIGTAAVQPYIVVGPSVGYLLEAKSVVEGVEDDVKDNLRDADVAIDGGIGVNFNLSQGSVFVEGRYSHGVYNVSGTETDVVIKNRGIHLVGGFTVRIGG